MTDTIYMRKKGEQRDTVFVQFLAQIFQTIGGVLVEKPCTFIFVVLLMTLLCSSSIPFSKMKNDVTDFTPYAARARKELQIYEQFFASKGEPILVYVFVTAKNQKSMFATRQLRDTVQLADALSNTVKLKMTQSNTYLPYTEFCKNFCEINEPVRNFYEALTVIENYNGSSDFIELTYPTTTILGQKFRVDNSFYGVKRNHRDEVQDINLVVLQFRAEMPNGTIKQYIENYELDIVDYIRRNFSSEVIEAVVMSPTFITSEIVRSGLQLLPFTAIGFIVMCIFSTLTITASSALTFQAEYIQVVIAVTACISPLLACSTAIGLLLWLGFRFGSILCVTPFLVLAIGVDDAFLMVHSWQKVRRKNRSLDEIGKHFSQMFNEVGPSITITTLTNVFAFAIGSLTPTPEIQLFCIGNALAMLIDFIYQIAFFAPILVITERFHEKLFSLSDTVTPGKLTSLPITMITEKVSKRRSDLKLFLDRILSTYCSILCSAAFSIFTLICLLIYWAITLYGAITIEVELRPEKLFTKDSDIIKVLKFRDEYIMPYYSPAFVFIGRPGNLTDSNNLLILHKIVENYESLPTSAGYSSTKFWLREYDEFMEPMDLSSSFQKNSSSNALVRPKDLEKFLEWPEFRHWNGFLHFRENFNGTRTVDKFFFIICSQGNLRKWSNRAKLLSEMREIADQYTEHEVSVYDDDAKFLDLIATLFPQSMQSSAYTIICMMFVCFIFIAEIPAVVIASASIISIALGVIGNLSLWGVDLDPIVMSALIMSIGFSVDIPAHVIYYFTKTDGDNVEDRLRDCFSTIVFPVAQAALSTLFCVFSLLFIDLHMAHVFVKTMTLVVTIGLIHGLIIIPVILNIFWYFQHLH